MRFTSARMMLMLAAVMLVPSLGWGQTDAPETTPDTNAEEQAEATEKLELPEVVVSASRSDMSVFDAPASVTVLTREDIEASPFERVEDIVRNVPGVYNFRHYGLQRNGIVSPLSMRGVGKNRVLLLVDGVPQNDNFNNAISWVAWGHIPKEAIERIEIVRGPTSALYGSEGLGGVINVITRTPKAQSETSVRAEGGTADTYAGHGFHSQKIGDLGLLFGGGYEESDGFYMVKDPESYEITRHREVGKIFGKLTYDLSPSSDLSLAALLYDHETGKGRKYFYDELTLDQYWMNYRHTGDLLDLQGLLYLNRADKKAFQDTAKDDFTSLLRVEEMPSLTWGADLQGTMPLASWASLTLGGAYKSAAWDFDNEYENSLRDAGANGRQQFISPFANLELRFLEEDLIVNIGARYDWIETSDGAAWDSEASAGRPAYDDKYGSTHYGNFSPKVGVAWHPDERTTLRASAGKGFRAPSLFELYKVHVRQGGTYYREANPNLKPEEIWSYDIGAERFLTESLWGRVAFYQSWAKDYIGGRLTGTGTFGGGKTRYEYQLDNISQVDIRGIETELRWDLRKDLTVFGNYTYNISTVKEDKNNPALEGNYLEHDPRHKVHAGLTYRNPKVADVSLIGNYYGDIYFDGENTLHDSGYFTVDVSVSRTFANGITAYVHVENILNEEYPIFRSRSASDTIAPGTIVSAGLQCRF